MSPVMGFTLTEKNTAANAGGQGPESTCQPGAKRQRARGQIEEATWRQQGGRGARLDGGRKLLMGVVRQVSDREGRQGGRGAWKPTGVCTE